MSTTATATATGGGEARGIKTLICYHYPCPDGVCAALAATLGLLPATPGASTTGPLATRIPGLEYLPLRVFDTVEQRVTLLHAACAGRRVETLYLLDFSGGLAFIQACAAISGRVVLLDHHKTAADDLAGGPGTYPANFEPHLRMDRCGTTMTCDHFGLTAEALTARLAGDATAAARLSTLFAYIEDHDLWRHALPHSREFAAGMASMELEMDIRKNPGVLDVLASMDTSATIEAGVAELTRVNAIVQAEASTAFPVAIPYGEGSGAGVIQCLAVVSAHPDLRSNLGNELATRSTEMGLVAAGVVAYVEEGMGEEASRTSYKVSMRAAGDAVDTTLVTKWYGGGGHKAASSCIVLKSVFDGWRAGPVGRSGTA